MGLALQEKSRMGSSKSLYMKAQKYNEKGDLEKALKFCEIAISMDLKNSAALNLKGLLYYYKGDIDASKSLWMINKDINNDSVAKGYIDAIGDEEKLLDIYNEAITNISQYEIKGAIEHLKICNKSSFNCINVYSALAKCYYFQGDYIKAKECADEVLLIDKKNKEAIIEIKKLKKIGIIKGSNSKKNGVLGICAIILLLVSGNYIYKNINIITKGTKTSTTSKEVNSIEKFQKEETENKEVEQLIFRENQVRLYIQEENYDALYNEISKFKIDTLSEKDKEVFLKGEEFLKNQGVKFYYIQGVSLINNSKDYKAALTPLKKGYQYSKGNYLRDDLLYFIALDYQFDNEKENEIKTLEQYLTDFKDGVYESAVLYRLMLIYKETDLDKAKVYANEIATRYSDDEYNNSIVRSILKD